MITNELLTRLRDEYDNNRMANAMTAALTKSDLDAVAYVRRNADKLAGAFTIELKTHGITSQEASGRCWMYGAMNLLREKVITKLKLESFELSGNYLSFYDKLEKAGNILDMAIEYAAKPLDDHMNEYLLQGVDDGGNWTGFVNLVKKYGLVPRTAMEESFMSAHTARFLTQFNRLVRKDIMELRRLVKEGKDAAARKEAMMSEIYLMECIAFGQPPLTFDFTCRNENDEFTVDYDITPMEFFQKYVGDDLDDYVMLCSNPATATPLGKSYTTHSAECLPGKNELFINLPIKDLKELALKQLKDGEIVVFSCDSRKYLDRVLGIWDQDSFDYEGVFGGVDLSMSKTDEVDSKESGSTHCMVLIGVNLDKNGNPDRWKIENSWGTASGKEGYFVCSDRYFERYVYKVIVRRKYLSEEQLAVVNSTPIEIKPWQF